MLLDEKYLQELTNEELVLLIQSSKNSTETTLDNHIMVQQYWDMLYKKTELMIYNVYKHNVDDRFKTNDLKDDIMMTLKTGWVKAVHKYNIEKDKEGKYFASFAKILMIQEYRRKYVNRFTATKNGVSVHEELIHSVKITKEKSNRANNDNSKDNLFECIQVDSESSLEFEKIELKDFLQYKLKQLKEVMPLSYEFIIANYFNGKTQVEIAKQYNLGQTEVSKKIKLGVNFLKEIITSEEKESLYKEREW